ncbi:MULTISPECIES: Hint domain-containing protein [Ochrobactrum]|uniref:Hint domain-containing protein n=1 Tax=Ochrobactrum chromiisoli TaxID=2993941 RepID=A0ABT3QMT0_9HYPH|nr:Hint domain-containing protein [Ochrobactrum chromiisoli]MCX2696905.1 Hint domain-containing protein [Ochrobactrum chromiisoli]
MSADKDRHSPSSRARRHFLGAAAGMIAKGSALGALVATVSSFPARALGTKWWEHGGGSGSNCLLKGTLIETAKGPVAVENLVIGDFVRTVDGSFMPVKWVGWQSHRKGGAGWNENIMPIRIARHAIDGKAPRRDLCLSPNHALFIDGVLIRAKDLVNGQSITRALAQNTIDYYNIVLDSHAVVLAEGAAVETYLMRGESYKSFTNFAEYEALYRGEARIVMQSFVPIIGYEGVRENIKALLCLSGILPMCDVVEETYQRLAAKAGEGVV